MKQNQAIAIRKSVKKAASDAITKAYHQHQRAELLTGLTRAYTPKDEDGETLPPERKLVQVRVLDTLADVIAAGVDLFDVTATCEWGNTANFADVVVDDQVVIKQAPVTFLLFLEKNLVDIGTLIAKLPVLDPAEQWSYSDEHGCFVTQPVQQNRTKKTPRHYTKAEATENHPAQVEMYYEDVQIGTWRTVKMSGAIRASDQAAMMDRVAKLMRAVKLAREEANGNTVERKRVATPIFDYVFRGEAPASSA